MLSGPRIALAGNTFGNTVLTGQALNHIRLDQGALYAPGNPTIIDNGEVSFDGVVLGRSLSSAMKAALELKIVHFLDNGGSGLLGQLVPTFSAPVTNMPLEVAGCERRGIAMKLGKTPRC